MYSPRIHRIPRYDDTDPMRVTARGAAKLGRYLGQAYQQSLLEEILDGGGIREGLEDIGVS